jgi:sterol desaturase/sphingolipid hydroxylase (fatty acid hydroxylase superfamily)
MAPATIAVFLCSSAAVISLAYFCFGIRLIYSEQYNARELFCNISIGLGAVLAGSLTIGWVAEIYSAAYGARIASTQPGMTFFVILLLADDLCYYIFHRASHSVHLWWASHSVHHSGDVFNLSITFRQPWTGRLTGQFICWLPLCLLGFPADWIIWQGGVSMAFQFWTHAEGLGKLPRPLEYVFNTPAHHRIHHAQNPVYRDKNFAGILIIWDRIFGTFAEEREDEPCSYIHTDQKASQNPFKVAFQEWLLMIEAVLRPGSFGSKLNLIFGAP